VSRTADHQRAAALRLGVFAIADVLILEAPKWIKAKVAAQEV
jgi:hypothetical protein